MGVASWNRTLCMGIKLTIDAQLLTLRGPGGRGGLTTGGLTVEDEEG